MSGRTRKNITIKETAGEMLLSRLGNGANWLGLIADRFGPEGKLVGAGLMGISAGLQMANTQIEYKNHQISKAVRGAEFGMEGLQAVGTIFSLHQISKREKALAGLKNEIETYLLKDRGLVDIRSKADAYTNAQYYMKKAISDGKVSSGSFKPEKPLSRIVDDNGKRLTIHRPYDDNIFTVPKDDLYLNMSLIEKKDLTQSTEREKIFLELAENRRLAEQALNESINKTFTPEELRDFLGYEGKMGADDDAFDMNNSADIRKDVQQKIQATNQWENYFSINNEHRINDNINDNQWGIGIWSKILVGGNAAVGIANFTTNTIALQTNNQQGGINQNPWWSIR